MKKTFPQKNKTFSNKAELKKHLPFQGVFYYSIFLYFSTPHQGLPYVTKEVDKSSLTIEKQP